MGDNRLPPREPQYFAEYSLWNASRYCLAPVNLIVFTRPQDDSIFLSPPSLELEEKVQNDEALQVPQQPRTRSSPGFERYMKRALKVVTREDLLRDPALFKKDDNSDDSDEESELEVASFARPLPRPAWRTAQQVNGRGRRLNMMQRRLEQALAQPARIERGASMMQRMGWEGGALGRSGSGIIEPIAPCANYSSATVGFGMTLSDSAQDSFSDSCSEGQTPPNRKKRTKTANRQKSKKQINQEFKINALLYIREFIKNDLQIELFFEPKLKNGERKRIHMLVAHLMGSEEEKLETMEMEYLFKDIVRRNYYTLGTQSEGEPPHRQICVYKEAKQTTYLVTPDDVRNYPSREMEEETNPFLKSITRHLKNDCYTEPTLLERIIDFFVEFSQIDDYTEFRFLGPFNIDEIDIMSAFFGMVTCLVEKRPYLDYPEHLVQVFEKGITYSAGEDANGFVSVQKHLKPKEEEKKEGAEENKEKKED